MGGNSIVSMAGSEDRWENLGFLGHYVAITVDAAPEQRSFAAKSSRSSYGGLHQLYSFPQALTGKCRLSTASAVPSRYFAL